MNKINKIKAQVKKECFLNKKLPAWFFESHLSVVEKYSKFLLEKIPEVNREVVLLGVWLHDMQRVRGIKGDHAKMGAREAVKMLKDFDCERDIITQVKEIILTHSCDNPAYMPKSIEAKVLASADAMSHYSNDFYLQIAVLGQRDLKAYKKWALEKLDKDYHKKIFFDFAKKEIKSKHDALKYVITMG